MRVFAGNRVVKRLRLVAHLARKLATVGVADLWRMLDAQRGLLVAQWLVWRRPAGSLIEPRTDGGAAGDTPPAYAIDKARAEQWAKAMTRAAYFGLFRPQCLVRSVALNRLLEREGLHGSRIRVGARVYGGRFQAHAWVEYGGTVIGDTQQHISTFTELVDVNVLYGRAR